MYPPRQGWFSRIVWRNGPPGIVNSSNAAQGDWSHVDQQYKLGLRIREAFRWLSNPLKASGLRRQLRQDREANRS